MKFSFVSTAALAFLASPFVWAEDMEMDEEPTIESLQAELQAVKAHNYDLLVMLNNSVSLEEAEMMTINAMIEEYARQDWGALPQVSGRNIFVLFRKNQLNY